MATYAEKWFKLDDSVDKARREELAQAFINDSSYVSDLRVNPLMLSLMCGIYSTERYIPTNRPDVYKKCSELLFERWDKQRGIVSALPFDAHVKLALNSLAFWLYSEPQNQDGLTREKLVRFMTRFLLQKRFEHQEEAENAANDFIDFCTGRAWVLTDMGSTQEEELYGFTHRTFLEYFAANQVVRLYSSAASLYDFLVSRLRLEEWDVVAQLALQILANNVEDGADDFLAAALGDIDGPSRGDEAVNVVAFCARSLGFIVPKPALLRRIVRVAVEMAAYGGQRKPLSALLQCSPENRPMATRMLQEVLVQQLAQTPDDERVLITALYLSHFGERPHVLIEGDRLLMYWSSVEHQIYESAEEAVRYQSSHRMWVAILRATTGQVPVLEVLKRYGPLCLYRFTKGDENFDPPLAYQLLAGGVLPKNWRMSAVSRSLDTILSYLRTVPPPWVPDNDKDFTYLNEHLHFMLTVEDQDDLPETTELSLLLLAPLIEYASEHMNREITFDVRRAPRASRLIRTWARARKTGTRRNLVIRNLDALDIADSSKDLFGRWIRQEVDFIYRADK